jgi:ribosomal protein S18 acetylase RimI-like enzyme
VKSTRDSRGPVDEESVSVRPAVAVDIASIAEIGSEAFSGLRPRERALEWVKSCFVAGPRTEYWVAEDASGIVGYILWVEKGGFRVDAVIELEQVAIRAAYRGRGIGIRLIRESIIGVEQRLTRRGSRLKLVEVTTGSEQNALEFYRKALGAKVVAQIPDYFRGTEYILIARQKDTGSF